MTDLLNVPARWESAPWMNHSNPPDAIDYERPREGFYMSTTPTDAHSADEASELARFIPTSKEKDPFAAKKEEEDPFKAKEEVKGKDEPKEDKVKEKRSDKLITAFQSFFSKSHPIIGKLYSGPKDGKMNPQLQAAAKAAEAKIGAEIGASVSGMVLSTTPADVQGAIAAIVKHKEGKGKKSSFLTRDERIVIFSSIIDNK